MQEKKIHQKVKKKNFERERERGITFFLCVKTMHKMGERIANL